jgi:hypothetical protein
VRAALASGLAVLALSAGARAQSPPAPTPHARSWAVPALHGAGLLLGQRVAAGLIWAHAFSLEDGERNLAHLRAAYTQPPVFDPRRQLFEWDGDRWEINFFGHGLMGSELYLRARQCQHGFAASIAFTAVSSVIWEYGVEVWNSRPSVNDLLWTPIGGALLGELRFVTWEMAAGLPRGARGVLRALVDPFGELERAAGAPC